METPDAANHLVVMRTAWQQVDQVWDLMITESRLLQTPAMTEATDLVLRMGRLVWDNPQWTPARSDRAPRRTPAALAPGANALNSVVAAVHQAVDALTRVAMTDIQAVEAADRAGRLYCPHGQCPPITTYPGHSYRRPLPVPGAKGRLPGCPERQHGGSAHARRAGRRGQSPERGGGAGTGSCIDPAA